jgi:hypothetical protein
MEEIPTVAHVPSGGLLLFLGLLCHVARAESTPSGAEGKAGHSPGTLSFRADTTTAKPEKIQAGGRIEAKVDEENLAQSLLLAPSPEA